MIFVLFVLSQSADLEDLYYTATTLLVQFTAEKEAAFNRLVELSKDTLYADTTIDFLISHFDTKVARQRHALKNIFKEVGQSAIKGIVEKIDYRGSDEESRSLKQSLWVLGEIGGDSIVEPVARFIIDKQWQVRSGACTALGKSKSRKAVPYLLEVLGDSVSLVRKSAFYGLSQLASEDEISYLIQGLGDKFFGVRYAAVDGLLRIGEAAVDPLGDAIGEDRLKDYFILKVLFQLSGEKDDGLEYARHADPAIRQTLYEACQDTLILKHYLESEKNELLKNYLIKRLSDLP